MNTESFLLRVRDDVYLRFIRPDEAETLFKLVDANRAYLREWLDWVDAQTSAKVSKENILKRIKKAEILETFDLGIFNADKLIGSMGFNSISIKNKKAEIGYWISREFQKQGIMTDCVRTLTSFGFNELKLHRIEIRCSTKNAKSSAIPERLGFAFEGVLRESFYLYDYFENSRIYSMLMHEWEQLK